MSTWAGGVWVGTFVYAIALSVEAVHRHRTLESVFDVAVYDQRLWLLSQFRDPFSTIVSKPFLGDHFEPGLVLFTPLYWLGAGIEGVLVVQTLCIALTAPALYALARTAGAGSAEASAPALLWLVCAAVSSVNLFGFRPATLISALLVLSVLAALRDRNGLLATTAVLALTLKEDIALTYFVLGLLLVWVGKRRVGWIVASGSAVVFLIAMVTIESLSEQLAWQSSRFGGARGDSPVDVLGYVVAHPLESGRDLVSHGGLSFAILLGSTAGLALLAPMWMLLALPSVSFNALSAYAPQHVLAFHYHLVALTSLFIAAALGVVRLRAPGRWSWAGLVIGLSAALTLSILGGLTTHRAEPARASSERADIRAALELVSPEASVSASPDFLPYLSRRVGAYSFPEPFVQIDWGGNLDSRERSARARGVSFVLLNGSSRPIEYEQSIEPIRARLLRSGFVVSFRSGDVEVLSRR